MSNSSSSSSPQTFRHPHHDIIVAWLEGKEIQILDPLDGWIDWPDKLYTHFAENKNELFPAFKITNSFRIKPEPKTLTCRVALMRRAENKFSTTTLDIGKYAADESDPSKASNFIQWISEPITVTLPE